jgi:hypothetical protein
VARPAAEGRCGGGEEWQWLKLDVRAEEGERELTSEGNGSGCSGAEAHLL